MTVNDCVFCLERESTIRLDPCGHVCLCRKCAPRLKACPLCRMCVKSRHKESREKLEQLVKGKKTEEYRTVLAKQGDQYEKLALTLRLGRMSKAARLADMLDPHDPVVIALKGIISLRRDRDMDDFNNKMSTALSVSPGNIDVLHLDCMARFLYLKDFRAAVCDMKFIQKTIVEVPYMIITLWLIMGMHVRILQDSVKIPIKARQYEKFLTELSAEWSALDQKVKTMEPQSVSSTIYELVCHHGDADLAVMMVCIGIAMSFNGWQELGARIQQKGLAVLVCHTSPFVRLPYMYFGLMRFWLLLMELLACFEDLSWSHGSLLKCARNILNLLHRIF